MRVKDPVKGMVALEDWGCVGQWMRLLIRLEELNGLCSWHLWYLWYWLSLYTKIHYTCIIIYAHPLFFFFQTRLPRYQRIHMLRLFPLPQRLTGWSKSPPPTPPHPTLIPGTICFLGTWTQWNPSFQMISTTTSRLPWAPSILFPHLIKCSEASSSTLDESVFSFSLSVSKLQRRLSFISAI